MADDPVVSTIAAVVSSTWECKQNCKIEGKYKQGFNLKKMKNRIRTEKSFSLKKKKKKKSR